MEHQVIERADPRYPAKLRERLGEDAPERICCHGPLDFLDRFGMSVICSDTSGGLALMETNQVLFTIREYDLNYIGGWYSVIETEIFRLGLWRDNTTVTLLSSKGLAKENFDSYLLDRFYPPLHQFPERKEYFRRSEEGELLMLSVSDPDDGRQSRKNIRVRNWTACALGDVVFIPYGPKGTKTYTMAKRIARAGFPAFTLDHEEARDLLDLGIPGYTRKKVGAFLESLGAEVAKPKPVEPVVIDIPELPPEYWERLKAKQKKKSKRKPKQKTLRFGKP